MLRPFPFLDIFFDDLEKFVYETDLFRELIYQILRAIACCSLK